MFILQNKTTILRTVRVSTNFMPLSLAVRTTTVVIPPLICHYCLKDKKFFGHFLSRINKLDQDFLHWQIYLFAPWETTWHRFYPISPWARTPKIAGIKWIRFINVAFNFIPFALTSSSKVKDLFSLACFLFFFNPFQNLKNVELATFLAVESNVWPVVFSFVFECQGCFQSDREI